MLIKRGLKSKLVVYVSMISMSTAAVFKFTPAFTWPIVPGLLLYRDNMYMKSN